MDTLAVQSDTAPARSHLDEEGPQRRGVRGELPLVQQALQLEGAALLDRVTCSFHGLGFGRVLASKIEDCVRSEIEGNRGPSVKYTLL